jgi:hypothetical protein
VATELASWITIERNNKLTYLGYILYVSIAVTCTITLFYPLIERLFRLNINCVFRTLTHLPCPTCGYSRAIANAIDGNFMMSIFFSPIWIILVLYQVTLIILSVKSIILSKAFFISNIWIILFSGLLLLNWILKFYIGSAYY